VTQIGHMQGSTAFLKTAFPMIGAEGLWLAAISSIVLKQRVPQLLQLLGNQGLGALIYTEKGKPSPLSTGISCRHLEEHSAIVSCRATFRAAVVLSVDPRY